jgi:hypothetical protein
MFAKVVLAAIGIWAAAWWAGFDINDAKDSFVEAIQGTGTHLAGDQGDDWG